MEQGSVKHARHKTKLELRQKDRVDVPLHNACTGGGCFPISVTSVLVGRKVLCVTCRLQMRKGGGEREAEQSKAKRCQETKERGLSKRKRRMGDSGHGLCGGGTQRKGRRGMA